MANYYEILGVRMQAGPNEIKAAFRKLAMVFHPDRNPEGQEHFRKILTAYETLMDPAKRRSYDFRLRYQSNAEYTAQQYQAKRKKTETWDEKEAKRRQYYNDYIRQFEKSTGYRKMEDIEEKVNYNEFKYILFATPLAVALFLLIMNLAAGTGPRKLTGMKLATAQPEIKMGDVPYFEYFGRQHYELSNTSTFKLNNKSGKDAVVCFFRKDQFIRSLFIKSDYSAQIAQLPEDSLSIRYYTGLNWKNDTYLKQAKVYGGFTTEQKFYETGQVVHLKSLNELSLDGSAGKGFIKINETDFFRTKQHDQKN